MYTVKRRVPKDFLQNAIGKTAKYFVVFIVCLFIWASNSILPIYYVMGGVVNSILSKVLKVIIRQPRPKNSPKGGHGMPSSHAQSISYFATVLEWKIYTHIVTDHVNLLAASPLQLMALLATAVGVLVYSYHAW